MALAQASNLGLEAFVGPKKTKTGPKNAANKAGNVGTLSSASTSTSNEPTARETNTQIAEKAAQGAAVAGVAGAAIGAGMGLVERNAAKKAANRNSTRPKGRKMAAFATLVRDKRMNEAAAVATLSQAVYEWSASLK